MTERAPFQIIVVFFCCAPFFVQAQTEPNNWDKLNLSSTTIAGAKVYFEKSFEPNLPFFEETYKQFLEQKKKIEIIKSERKQITTDIFSILGIKDVNTLSQEKTFSDIVDILTSINLQPLYLVKKSTIKDFLKAGGQLPNFKYNKITDYVQYNPSVNVTSDSKIPGNLEFAFVIESSETFEEDIKKDSEIFNFMSGGIICGGIIHEFTELSLLIRVKSSDPYLRWFSDGVANSVAYELVKKYMGEEDANNFISKYDVNKYEDIKKEINLQYWMASNFCILSDIKPTEIDERFSIARYAYATYEIQNLIRKYGLECIGKIIDEITTQASRTGADLLIAIRNVTGEDMYLRMGVYQDFRKRQEGIDKYGKIYNEAKSRKDYEQMIISLLRAHELRSLSNIQLYIQDYTLVSIYLFKIGLDKEAESTMSNCMEFCSMLSLENKRELALNAYIVYAFGCDQALKASKQAEELLKLSPDNPDALAVKVFICLENNQPDEAIELAKKIIKQTKDKKSIGYTVATSILSFDPNQTKLNR
ncbi:MAG: tetratricopeptide repeat protein [Sedimentisphaerales bacterium]|nr:tetratricopeptide repeat protein [Sedimentisphaerales bacterium]